MKKILYYDPITGTSCYKSDSSNTSKYYWLFDYTYNCTIYGCKVADSPLGYWTSPQETVKTAVWHINSNRFLGNPAANSSNPGIRPVIKVPKI